MTKELPVDKNVESDLDFYYPGFEIVRKNVGQNEENIWMMDVESIYG